MIGKVISLLLMLFIFCTHCIIRTRVGGLHLCFLPFMDLFIYRGISRNFKSLKSKNYSYPSILRLNL